MTVTKVATSPVPVASELPAYSDDAKTFLREFTRELLREVSPITKLLCLLSVVAVVSGVLYLGHAALVRYSAQRQQDSTQAQILTRRLDEQEKVLGHLSEKLNQRTQQITDVAKTSDLKPINDSMLHGPSLTTKLWN